MLKGLVAIYKKPFRLDEIKKWLDGCETKSYPDNELSDMPIRKNLTNAFYDKI